MYPSKAHQKGHIFMVMGKAAGYHILIGQNLKIMKLNDGNWYQY